MSLDAMKQALSALETVFMPHHPAVIKLRAAIEQAERQEPCMRCNTPKKCSLYGCSPLTWPAEKEEKQEPVVNIELSRRMAAVKVNNFYGSIIKDAEKEIERLHGLVLQHTAPPHPEKQEPVAWVEKDGELVWCDKWRAIGRNLYTAPSAAQRQPLTKEEIREIAKGYALGLAFPYDGPTTPEMFARAIERAHGIGGVHD